MKLMLIWGDSHIGEGIDLECIDDYALASIVISDGLVILDMTASGKMTDATTRLKR